MKSAENRIKEAVEVAGKYGTIDGSHHKMWVIDKMCRILLDKDYDKWVEETSKGENGDHGEYPWDEGIAP